MRPDGPIANLTEAQKKMASIAGIPADRIGLGAEYPKMVYRPGANPRHQLENRPLKMGNGASRSADKLGEGYDNEIAYVDYSEDEAQALADGWFLTPDRAGQEGELVKQIADRAKDDEIASLRAQLAASLAQAPVAEGEPARRGRPPKALAPFDEGL